MIKFNYLTITTIILLMVTLFTCKSESFTPVECDLCQLSVDELSEMVRADNLTYAEIFAALERICETIPSKYSGICMTALNQSGDAIIHQILNGTNSNQVCRELQVCTASSSSAHSRLSQVLKQHQQKVDDRHRINVDEKQSIDEIIKSTEYIQSIKSICLNDINKCLDHLKSLIKN